MERLFAWIIEVNQLPPDTPVPRFRWVDEDKPDKTRAEVAEIALRAIPPALVPLAWARQQFGMPEPEAGETMVAAPVSTPTPSLAASFASGLPRPDWQGAVDGLMEHALAMAQPASQKQAEAIARVIRESKDYEELSARLAEVMRGLDGEVVAAVMEQATLAAQLYGRWSVREEAKRG